MCIRDSNCLALTLQQLLQKFDEVGARKNAVDEEIERLSQPGGSKDQRLNALAERFGGDVYKRQR